MTRGADLVVVDDLQSVRTATKWEVYLHGGAIANVDYIKSTGAGGACISFKAAVRSRPLQVWVSAAFALRFPYEHRILEDAIGSAGSRWTSFAGSNVEFVTRALRSNTTKIVGLVTRKEFAAFPRDFANVHTTDHFLNNVRCIDAKTSHVHGA